MRTLAMCGCIIALATLAQGQSLGEVAERAKEERKKQGAAKSYTEDDLDRAAAERAKRGDSGESGTVDTAPTAQPARASRPAVHTRSTGQPSSDMATLERKIEMWRGRYASAKARVESLEKEVAALEDEKSRTVATITVPDDPYYERPVVVRNAVNARLDTARRDLAQARKELETITEQARADGVTSGQLY
jgi:hypothetical protein